MPARKSGPGPRVAVIGAGIIGASIAYHLARRGAEVTLLDKGRPAGEATEKSFAWINAAYGNPEPYFRLRQQSMLEYRRLAQELDGALRINWGGCLSWDLEPAEIERYVRQHSGWGYDVRLVERAEIAALEPRLVDPPACAAYAAGDGSLDPVAATEALLTAAEKAGAALKLGSAVTAIGQRGGRVTGLRSDGASLEADAVVLAAGSETGALCATLGVALPMRSSPGLLLHCKPTERLIDRVIESPGLHIKQEADGRLVAGEDFGGGPAPNDPDAIAQRLLGLIRERLRGADGIEPERVTIGLRPMTADGFPAVGFAPQLEGLYVAVMHSGITLAPAVGRFAAMEILDDARVGLLAPYRPERFASAA